MLTSIQRRPHTRGWVASLAAALIISSAMACSLVQRFSFSEPRVQLQRIAITGLSTSGGTLRLHLDVHNPNPYDLRGSEFSADLALEGSPFGGISREEAFSLPAESHAPVVVELRFTWAGVGAAARGIVSRGAVDYELRGRILVDTPIDDRWVEITTGGTATLEQIMSR